MRACAQAGKQFVVLDRPNPIGGVHVEGSGDRAGLSTRSSGFGVVRDPPRHDCRGRDRAVACTTVRVARSRASPVITMRGWTRDRGSSTRSCRVSCRRRTCRPSTPRWSIRGCASSRAPSWPGGSRHDAPVRVLVGAPHLDGQHGSRAISTRCGCRACGSGPSCSRRCSRSTRARQCGGVQLHVTNARCVPPVSRPASRSSRRARDQDPARFRVAHARPTKVRRQASRRSICSRAVRACARASKPARASTT